MARERNESGRYVETVAPDEVLGTFDAVDGPVITSTDVAEYLECTTEAARQKLKRLVEEEILARRRTGRTFIYWRTPEAPGAESGRETGETPSEVSDDQRVGQAAGGRTSPERATEESDETDRIGDALDGWEPDTQANPRTARAQTRRVADHLRSVAEYRRKSELVDALAGDSTLGRRSWWERAVRPGLARLAERDLVEYTRNRGWRWIGHLDREGAAE